MYDIKNPRAKLLEFNSTHPLSGKRIKALMKYTNQPMFDFDKIETELQVDQNKMQKKFLSELFMLCLPYISVALSLAGVLLI
jgi:predicted Zn-dependent protease